MSAREHVVVERVFDFDDQDIFVAGAKEMSYVDGEGGVALAEVFAGFLAVEPQNRRMEDAFKFDADTRQGR
jgi:hypothetical protein